jgi:hypothetical protein
VDPWIRIRNNGPFKAKHQRTQECTDVTSQNFTKIFSHPYLKHFHRNNSIYKITTPLLRSEGGNLPTDAAQLFRFDPIPAKAKKLGLLSIYKFSLIPTILPSRFGSIVTQLDPATQEVALCLTKSWQRALVLDSPPQQRFKEASCNT